MRTRSIALALTTFALCATTVLPAAAQQRYRVTDLGTLGGDYSVALAINNRGQVIGQAGFDPFLYSDGAMRALRIPAARGRLDWANAINNRGWVTGLGTLPASATCSGCGRAYIHDGRTTKFLGHLADQEIAGTSSGYGINSAGHVTGGTSVSVPGGEETHAFVYDGKRMRDLGTLGGTFSFGHAINRWDWVAGLSFIAGAGGPIIYHAFVYKNGVMRDLGTLGGSSSNALAINNKGWVTGQSENSGGVDEAFIHDGRSMRGLGPETAYGNDINSRGWVVGQGSGGAFLYDGTAVRNLNDLLTGPNHGKWRLLSAYGINDKGQIVGIGLPNKLNTNIQHAFLLTPVAETE